MSNEVETAIRRAEGLLAGQKAFLLRVLEIKKRSQTPYEAHLLEDDRTLAIYSAFCFHVFETAFVSLDLFDRLPESEALETCKKAARDYLLSDRGVLGGLIPTPEVISRGEALADEANNGPDARAVRAFASFASDHMVLGDPDGLPRSDDLLTKVVTFEDILR